MVSFRTLYVDLGSTQVCAGLGSMNYCFSYDAEGRTHRQVDYYITFTKILGEDNVKVNQINSKTAFAP